MERSLPVLNLREATFECTFGRGCDGICCQNGRPMLYPEEVDNLDSHLGRILPRLRAEAQQLVLQSGYLSNRKKFGLPVARVVAGWCVFFNQGCVLHTIGAEEGDRFKYKPAACSLFPLARDEHDRWYVRQVGCKGEPWDLFCLRRENSSRPAAESLKEEIALARRYEEQSTLAHSRQS